MEFSLTTILFWIFSILGVGLALMVMVNRNPVASALCLVLTIVFVAALMILLGAFFLGTIQILVYAGAVMVLFLFIIMLLDLKAEAKRRFSGFFMIGATVVCGISGCVIWNIVKRQDFLTPTPNLETLPLQTSSDVKILGKLLFTDFLLPFQLTGVLLLVAMIGVILLCSRERSLPSKSEANK